MDDGTRVEWREWGADAFAEARRRDRPVLLSLSATWCDDCQEMDRETYAEPTVAALIHDAVVPVRVDVDRRPRIRDRYNAGGFPSTVFLGPDGRVLSGAGYLGPDAMRSVVDGVADRWRRDGADAGRVPRPLQGDEPPAGELDREIEAELLARLREAHDERAGGFGDGPKFPLPDALEFALKRDRRMALRSFDAVGANLLDEHEGGFYRLATERDWSGIRHEKLLDANGALVRAFSNAYLAAGEDRYRTPAERTIEYLTTTLWLPDPARGAFAGSQAPGDPGSYTLDPSDRESDRPPVDRTVLAGANALAIEGLSTYHAYTDDGRARDYAERALGTLRELCLADGTVRHYVGIDRVDSGSDSDGSPRLVLADQARVLAALSTAASVLGDDDALADATAVAETTVRELRDGASFLDGPASGAGLLDRPLRPLDGNVELADALVDLAVLAGEDRYREIAREALADFAGASDRFGPSVARYGTVVARLLAGPLVVRVGSPAGSDLHRAALRVADHEKVVVPDAADLARGRARVERGERRSAVAETPAEVSDRVADVLE